jgi:pimeloyl-ACP methyl ester carboxylesterase
VIKEKVVRFGSAASLVGILSEPEVTGDVPRPAFIVLNAGVLHRVGPARLHVALARKLAGAGFAALRLDFSGIGDSEPSRDTASFDTRCVLEVQEAMDYLTRTRGVDRFVLFGLCSGADAAFAVARKDGRVAGHVSLDGFAYRTFGYYVHYYRPRVLNVSSWAGFAARQMRSLGRMMIGLAGRKAEPGRPSLFTRRFPPREEAAADLSSLAARGVRQFFVYSAGHERWYNHAGQFDSMFRDVYFNGGLTVRYFDEADHTFPDLRQQDALTTAVRDWAVRTWPATPEAEPVTFLAPGAEAAARDMATAASGRS